MATLIINPNPVSFTLTTPAGVAISFNQPTFSITTNGVMTQSAVWGGITGTLSAQTDLQSALNAKENSITAGTTSQYYRGDKTFQTLDKTAVGLGNVDNTSDATKNSASATLTNKTINLTNNTLTGTTAQFNTALSDGDFATLGGSETLTNKTLTDPVLNAGGVTGRILISMVQTSLGSNYNATAGTGEEEVTGLRVTLPILASGTYQIKITLKGYLGTVTGNNNIRIRLGTSTTYLSNTLLDNGYVGGAKTIESYLGTVIVTANLSAQNYVVIGFANDANRNGASFSASGTRTNVLVEIFK